ncbi:MAG: WD40/YVTN/BNR-like repeat-containing protein [Aggregatilineales bacterium]
MRVKRFRIVRFSALLALAALAVSTGFVSNAQAAPTTIQNPHLIHNHWDEGTYEAIRYGENQSTTAYLAEYNKAQAMKSASALPGAVHRDGNIAASPNTYAAPGGRWTAIGPTVVDSNQGNPFFVGNFGPNTGRAVAIVPDTNTSGANTVLYEAASGGGVWKSVNNGASWTPLTDNMPVLQMGALAMDPNNHQILYAGTGENNRCQGCGYGIGVYQTSNGGASWTILGGMTACTIAPFTNCNPFISTGTFTAKFNVLAVDPRNSDVLWTAGRNGLWKYTNSTSTWTQITTIPVPNTTAIQMSDLVVDPATSPSTLYVAAVAMFGGNASSGLFKSVDGGTTWTDLTQAMLNSIPAGYNAGGINWNDRTLIGRTVIGMAPSNHLVLYVAPIDKFFDVFGTDPNNPQNGGMIFKSADGGSTWTAIGTPNAPNGAGFPGAGQGWYDLYIKVDPANGNIVYFGGVDIDRTMDGGISWTNLTKVYTYFSGVHPDQHNLAFIQPASGSTGPTPFYIANDGGIYSSLDGGNTWANLNSNQATLEVYDATGGANFANQPLAWAGMQDNGSSKYTSNPVWANLNGGDGGFTAIDPTNQKTVYNEYTGVSMNKATDGGYNWFSATTGISGSANAMFIAPYIMDPNAGFATNTGYTPPAGGPTPTQAWNKHLLFGADQLYETLDGAAHWCAISPVFTNPTGNPGTGQPVSAIAIAASTTQPNAETIYAGLQNGQVWRTTNGFVSANTGGTCTAQATWTRIDGGLIVPGGTNGGPYISGIAVDDADPTAVYVTASFGGRSAAQSSSPHTFRTPGAGNFTSWTSMDGTTPGAMLPNVNANTVVTYRTTSSSVIVVGTDLGVYFSTNTGTSWTAINTGLPNAFVNQLAIDFAHTTLLAATKSRSVFAMPIPQLTPAQMGSGDTIGVFFPNLFGGNGQFELSYSVTSGTPNIVDNLGSPTDLGITGDWTGTGTSTVGVYRSQFTEFILKDSNAQSAPATHAFVFGANTDTPIAGDWLGAGHKNVGVYRPNQGAFYLRNSLTTGFADEVVVFGPANSIPIAGDWDGSGVDHVGVYSNGTFYLTTTSCAVGTACAGTLYKSVTFGVAGDLPVVGDWTHSGTTDIGIYRPSNGTFYLCLSQSCVFADVTTAWQGDPGSPLAGHFNNSGTPLVAARSVSHAAPPSVLVPSANSQPSTSGAQPANTGLGD